MGKNISVKKVTLGICESLLDLFIWHIALVGASIGKKGSRGVYRAFSEADDFLKNVNHTSLTAAWYKLKKKKLIFIQKRKNLYSPAITRFAKKRLEQIIPFYHQKRPWDEKIYLITYDIPENAHTKRSKLRRFLQGLNCRKMQESVWISPYNIRELLNEFIAINSIPGFIIISDIGKDGGVGETTAGDLMRKLYNLDELNKKYHQFINHVTKKNKPLRELIFAYLAILKEDPQLPFELLPPHFLGNQAYIIYKKIEYDYIQIHIRPDR